MEGRVLYSGGGVVLWRGVSCTEEVCPVQRRSVLYRGGVSCTEEVCPVQRRCGPS